MAWRERLVEGLDYLREAAEDKLGLTVLPTARRDALVEAEVEGYATRRELDLLGWHTLDYLSGSPHEVKADHRRRWAIKSRYAWMNDPMAGSAVDLLNDFTFGRGVPKPRARHPEVQKVIDTFWDDPDNQAVLTGYMAQSALGTDLTLQSNLFILFFDDGKDGRVKLGLLDHDTVLAAVPDPDNRLRVLYYVAKSSEVEWDFEKDGPKEKLPGEDGLAKTLYYPHWRNVKDAEDDAREGRRENPPPKPPPEKLGEGRVYHIAVNRTTEMKFGVPVMQRTLRWFSAYNDMMSARVDMIKAAAALVMKRKVKGGPTQLAKMAAQAAGLGGEIGTAPYEARMGPHPAGVVQENENVSHEAFNLDSGAGNAVSDATMLRSQVSAGTRFPQHYLGDQGNANLATATAMDLPVTKMVEARQELFEQLIRTAVDLAIDRAVEEGVIKNARTEDEERVLALQTLEAAATNGAGPPVIVAPPPKPKPPTVTLEPAAHVKGKGGEKIEPVNGGGKNGLPPDDGAPFGGEPKGPASDGKVDLSYEFKMPNPLRRLMTDLVTAIQLVAQTFDPNGTNIELNRTLLTIVLGEALEIQDPGEVVARIFPKDYIDPLVKMELESGGPPPPPGMDGSVPVDEPPVPLKANGKPAMKLTDLVGKKPRKKTGPTQAAGGEPGSGRRSAYGAKSGATPREKLKEGALDLDALADAVLDLAETRYKDLPEDVQAAAEERIDSMLSEFDLSVGALTEQLLDRMPALVGEPSSNGHA